MILFLLEAPVTRCHFDNCCPIPTAWIYTIYPNAVVGSCCAGYGKGAHPIFVPKNGCVQ